MHDLPYELLLGEPSQVRFTRVSRNHLHRHNFFEPCYVLSGTGDFYHENEHMTLRPGDLFIANPGSSHEITSLKTRDLNLYYTSFAIAEKACPRSDELSVEGGIIRKFLEGHRLKVSQQQQIGQCFRYYAQLQKAERVAQHDYFVQQQLRLLVLQIMASLASIEETDSHFPRALARIRKVIEAQPGLTVPELARLGGVSERSLRRLFRDRLDRTITREIQERKIERAAALLGLPELTVAEVGQRIGIDDPGQFTRLFKKIMGLTPRDFRHREVPHSPENWRWVNVGAVSMRTEFL